MEYTVVSCRLSVAGLGLGWLVGGVEEEGLEAAAAELRGELVKACNLALELRGATADVFAFMGVAGRDGGEFKASRELRGECVLPLRTAPILGLDGNDMGVGGVRRGAIEG